MMTSAQVVETSVTTTDISPSQDYTLIPPPSPPPPHPKWMSLISNPQPAQYCINKIFKLSPVFRRFQNGCNKVVIEPRVVQFWSEIILVITNRTSILKSLI